MSEDFFNFLRYAGRLKHLDRAGWVRKGVKRPESVASHSYRVALCAFAIKNEDIDRLWCMKMALVHDLAEAIVGDITPEDGVSDGVKHAQEQAALSRIVEGLDDATAEEISELWKEYAAASTEEARYVKDFDKFDMILQATEYEEEQGMVLEEFFESTRGKWRTREVADWAKVLESKRASSSE